MAHQLTIEERKVISPLCGRIASGHHHVVDASQEHDRPRIDEKLDGETSVAVEQ